MANAAYIRVSTIAQDTLRQREAIANTGMKFEKIVEEKRSGKDLDRPALRELCGWLREGDDLYVASIDRLGRKLTDVMGVVDELRQKGVRVHFLKEGQIIGGEMNAVQEFFIQLMAAAAQMERSFMLERQKEANEARRAAGKPVGRGLAPKIKQQLPYILKDMEQRKESMSDLCRKYKVARSTMYRIRDNAIRDGKLPEIVKVKKVVIN
ncbi:recombinase family protein [Escherichia coli]|uniref:recombinase family protein n=1 Tax=Escherichia coli TaxID=562 RepID=UPI0012FFAB3B|nr:recombinase family protein [Escherichia coli]